jgi:hypothetical protein
MEANKVYVVQLLKCSQVENTLYINKLWCLYMDLLGVACVLQITSEGTGLLSSPLM